MPSTVQLDACGRRRSPATLPSFHQGRPPRNKGERYPADPPKVEEIIAVMHAAGDDHADLAITSVYLRGIDNTEIVHAVHERPAPMIPATHGP